MSTEANTTLIRRWFDEFANQQNSDVLDELYTPDWVGHFPASGDLHGADAHKELGRAFYVAFPDARYTIESTVAEEDLVVVYYSMRGTHLGELLGIPATGKPFAVTGMNLYRIAGGKIAEQWAQFDTFGLLRQLGVLPSAQ
jgi:steroid delta-isomerase-like uncharacterized protein